MNTDCKVVAEACCNHQGSIEVAKFMIDKALVAGATYVKFQKRNNEYLSSIFNWDKAHPNPDNSFGSTYKKHREFLEFTEAQHIELFEHCEYRKIKYTCSAWDIYSAKFLMGLNIDFIKIPSAMNNQYGIIDEILSGSEKDIHVSFGMTTEKEFKSFIKRYGKHTSRIVLYHCTSGYPVPFEEIYLKEITKLKSYGFRVGFSGHHLGIAVDIAAYTLGAEFIERHFSLDKTMKGTDQSASLEPYGLEKLVHDLHNTRLSLQNKNKDISPCEVANRKKLRQ